MQPNILKEKRFGKHQSPPLFGRELSVLSICICCLLTAHNSVRNSFILMDILTDGSIRCSDLMLCHLNVHDRWSSQRLFLFLVTRKR